MRIEEFKHDFKKLDSVCATDRIVLVRAPLELRSLTTGETIAAFDSLDEALAYEIDGKTLEKRVADWTEITFPAEAGGED